MGYNVWDKQWTMSNGGVSKASKTLHLSEDIFGGMNVIMRGGAVSYQEFIHVGKGRDMGFIAINGFEQKISAGNALQCSSRELYRMGKFFDIFRLMSFYFTGAGFFLTNRITTGIIYLLCVTRVVMALLDSEELQMTFFEDAPPSGDAAESEGRHSSSWASTWRCKDVGVRRAAMVRLVRLVWWTVHDARWCTVRGDGARWSTVGTGASPGVLCVRRAVFSWAWASSMQHTVPRDYLPRLLTIPAYSSVSFAS